MYSTIGIITILLNYLLELYFNRKAKIVVNESISYTSPMALLIMILPLLDNSLMSSYLNFPFSTKVFGLTLLTLGVITRISFHLTWLHTIKKGRQQWQGQIKIMNKGPYRLVRNPMWLGTYLILFGLYCASASLPGLGLTILFWIPFSITQIKLEEKKLKKQFGKSYMDYHSKTKAIIPFIV